MDAGCRLGWVVLAGGHDEVGDRESHPSAMNPPDTDGGIVNERRLGLMLLCVVKGHFKIEFLPRVG
jgi:hypothetical protein